MFHSAYFLRDPVASHQAGEASRKANQSATKVELLGYDVEKLLMITEALWQILQEHHGYTDDELRERVMKIDMRDGKLDGKVASTPPTECPDCQRPINKRRSQCIYCGHKLEPDLFTR